MYRTEDTTIVVNVKYVSVTARLVLITSQQTRFATDAHRQNDNLQYSV
jgi:hypothetical protein